jgi:hypothetical protein
MGATRVDARRCGVAAATARMRERVGAVAVVARPGAAARMRVAAAVVAGLALVTAPAAAGAAPAADVVEPRSRQGYYLSVGLLAGATRHQDEGESLGTWGASLVSFRLGQLLTRRLGLGLQIGLSNASKGSKLATTFGLGLDGHVEVAHNLAVHGGVGLGVLQLTDSQDKDAGLRGTFGAEYVVGASYAIYPFDGRASGGFSLTPLVQARLLPGDAADGLMFLLGVEVAWWTGLPRNQLILPDSEAYKK